MVTYTGLVVAYAYLSSTGYSALSLHARNTHHPLSFSGMAPVTSAVSRDPSSFSVSTTFPLHTISRWSTGTIERSLAVKGTALGAVANFNSPPTISPPSMNSMSGPFVANVLPLSNPSFHNGKVVGHPGVQTYTRSNPTWPRMGAA